MNIFEAATRAKIRFETDRGNLSVEDLWDLPLTSAKSNANLDAIARRLHAKLQAGTVSFVTETGTTASAALDTLKFDVVKAVIEVRIAENKAAAAASARRAQKAKIMELLERKREAALESKSEEELLALLESL